ncbi:MAG: hypothetical protein ACUVWA_11130 [Candidatus Oleimicrobiaceae bacterium]
MVLAAAGLSVAASAQQLSWHRHSRLQLGVEQDSNIKEAAQGAEAAPSLRLLLDAGRRRQLAQGTVDLSLQGGYQAYWGHADQDKAVGELTVGASWPAADRWAMGTRASLRLKTFLRDGPDYAHASLTALAQARLPARTALALSCTRQWLNYAGSSLYDAQAWGTEMSVSRALWSSLTATATCGVGWWSLERPAFAYDWNLKLWRALPTPHGDRLISGGLRVEFHTWGQWGVTYAYEKNKSNSCGYSFSRHRLSLLAGMQLGRAFLLRTYALLQRKRYAETPIPALPVDLDTEREQSNMWVVDLSRPLTNRYTAIFRLARYDNESLVRGRYYQKVLINLSFQRRL